MKLITSFIFLVFLVGLPKAFGTELPLAIFVLPFFYKEYIRYFSRYYYTFRAYYLIFVIWFTLSVSYFVFLNIGLNDLFFANILIVKIILVLITAIPIYEVIKKCPNSLFLWIVFQVLIIVLSIFSQSVYNAMLYFISPRSAATFLNIYGLRSIGFGLFHIDGALILVSMSFYYLLVTKWKPVSVILYYIIFPIATTVARSAIVPFMLLSFVKKRLVMSLLVMFVSLLIISNYIYDGILFEALEIFRVVNQRILGSDVTFRSTDGVVNMLVFPVEQFTYLYGDGRFYDPIKLGRFYQDTDVGYSRIVFYSGLGGLLIYIYANLYLNMKIMLLSSNSKTADSSVKLTNFFLTILFLSMMVKGISSMVLLTPMLYFYISEKKNKFI